MYNNGIYKLYKSTFFIATFLSLLAELGFCIMVAKIIIDNVYDMEFVCLYLLITTIITYIKMSIMTNTIKRYKNTDNMLELSRLKELVKFSIFEKIIIVIIIPIFLVYSILWYIADLYWLSSILYYFVMVFCCINLCMSIIRYLKEYNDLLHIINQK